jgi:hypothetical protein
LEKNMPIHIARGDQQFGPYELDRINSGLQDGSFQPTDLAWSDGMSGWVPLAQYPGAHLANRSAPPIPPAPAPNPSAASPATEEDRLRSTAGLLQKAYMVLFGSSIALIVLQISVWGYTGGTELLWALTLGGAVVCRIKRTAAVNRLNQITNARGGPSSI